VSLKLAVFVSGGGSNLQSIIDKVEAGILDAEIRLVLSNSPDAYGLERAKKHGIESVAISHKDYAERENFDRAMIAAVHKAKADTVILAGFMRLLTPMFISEFPLRILNIHPALLPSFAGIHGQGDAADYGVKLSGCTVHFVDEKMDHGPVIIQAAVPVVPGEDGKSLGERILKFEHRIYPQAIQWLAEARLSVQGRHVFLRDTGAEKAVLDTPGLVNPELEKGF